MDKEFVEAASTFCVPTAMSFLTGFSRQAVVHGLVEEYKKLGHPKNSYQSGGWNRAIYMSWARSRDKKILQLGHTIRGPRRPSSLGTGLFLISGEVAYKGGHCFLVWNGLIFDNCYTCIPADQVDYLAWYYTPVVHSQFEKTANKILKAAA